MKPRGLWVAGNWKMNLGVQATQSYLTQLKQELRASDFTPSHSVRLALFPSAELLTVAATATTNFPLPLLIGAQNVHWESKGAFTGEISPASLSELGIPAALVGHSERRQYFGETDETAAKRLKGALNAGLIVIFCVGETRAERESNQTSEVLRRQLAPIFTSDFQKEFESGDRILIAYEPVWAIGTGLTATPEQAQEAHQEIRLRLQNAFGSSASTRTPILYGGSVTPENAKDLFSQRDVDGGLVGGASVDPHKYAALVRIATALSP